MQSSLTESDASDRESVFSGPPNQILSCKQSTSSYPQELNLLSERLTCSPQKLPIERIDPQPEKLPVEVHLGDDSTLQDLTLNNSSSVHLNLNSDSGLQEDSSS